MASLSASDDNFKVRGPWCNLKSWWVMVAAGVGCSAGIVRGSVVRPLPVSLLVGANACLHAVRKGGRSVLYRAIGALRGQAAVVFDVSGSSCPQ